MRALATILLFCVLRSMNAQQDLYGEPTILYSRQIYGGPNLNLNGFGGFLTYAKYRDAFRLRVYNLDINFVKHEKETKAWTPLNDPNARSYFYGKENNFYTIRMGIGNKKIFTEKLRKSGVQLSYLWQAGPVFGFTKPVYLEIIYTNEGQSRTYYLEVERFDADKHFVDNIYGRASGLRGLGELKFHPGIFAKFAFNFEYSNYKDGLKGIETGLSADVFTQRIPIMSPKILKEDMSNPRNHQIFLSLYINFFFGKKYNKS